MIMIFLTKISSQEIDFVKRDFDSSLVSIDYKRMKYTKEGIELFSELTGHPPISLLTINEKLTGDVNIKVMVKMNDCDFRVFLGDYFFIFTWGGSKTREHHLRNKINTGNKIVLPNPKLLPNVWYLFEFIIIEDECQIFVDGKLITKIRGKTLENNKLQIFTAHNNKIIINNINISKYNLYEKNYFDEDAFNLLCIDFETIFSKDDNRIKLYSQKIDSLKRKVKNSKKEISDIIVTSQSILLKHNIKLSLYKILCDLDYVLPEDITDIDLSEIASLYITKLIDR